LGWNLWFKSEKASGNGIVIDVVTNIAIRGVRFGKVDALTGFSKIGGFQQIGCGANRAGTAGL
jgi:hypothetical protein